MKKYIVYLLAILFALPAAARQPQAKAVLDKAAEKFRKAGGVEIAFDVKSYRNGQPEGASAGVIRLKGEKFALKTPEASTWFDGETQWSYLEDSGEVNISTPTPEELQSINPYTLLYIYKKGFSCQLGTVTAYRGKAVTEVILTATEPQQELSRIVLYVTDDTYQPVCIQLEQRGEDVRSEIVVTGYKTGQRYPDEEFVFDAKQYPDAEMIDLR